MSGIYDDWFAPLASGISTYSGDTPPFGWEYERRVVDPRRVGLTSRPTTDVRPRRLRRPAAPKADR